MIHFFKCDTVCSLPALYHFKLPPYPRKKDELKSLFEGTKGLHLLPLICWERDIYGGGILKQPLRIKEVIERQWERERERAIKGKNKKSLLPFSLSPPPSSMCPSSSFQKIGDPQNSYYYATVYTTLYTQKPEHDRPFSPLRSFFSARMV